MSVDLALLVAVPTVNAASSERALRPGEAVIVNGTLCGVGFLVVIFPR
jgi:hypothetical protein